MNSNSFWRQVIVLSILTAILCSLSIIYSDQLIAQAINDPAYAGLRHFSGEITDIGLGAIYFVLSILIYVSAIFILPRLPYFKKRPEWLAQLRYASGFSLVTFFFVGLINLLFKILFGRQRPHLTETFESFNFDPINFHWHWHSFPSGHTQVLFVVATLLSLAWPRGKWFFLFTAFLLALTRVLTHQHFLSDVVLGASIGYLGTMGVYHYQTRKNRGTPINIGSSSTN